MKAAVILVALVIAMAAITLYSSMAGSFPGLSVPIMQAPGRTPIRDDPEHRLEPFRDIAGSADEMYRLIEIAELSGATRSILLMRNGTNYSLRYQAVKGAVYGPVPPDTTVVLSEEEWNEGRKLIEDMEFWEMPSLMKPVMTDGVTVVLEGFREGRYHYIDRELTAEKSVLSRYCARMGNITDIRIGLK